MGSYVEEDVFITEIRAVRTVFDARFGSYNRSIALLNNLRNNTEFPPTTVSGLRRATIYVADLIDEEEDLIFRLLTFHGSNDHHIWHTAQEKQLQHLIGAGRIR